MPTAPMYLKPDSTYFPREKPTSIDIWNKRSESQIDALKKAGKMKVDEAEYWAKYSENGDENYEWNNGYLEVKPVSDLLTNTMHDWFTKLIDYYLGTYQNGQKIFLETAFRLPLSSKTAIRKPDYGVVLHSNPVPLEVTGKIHSYLGTCDLCVEALSDSKPKYIEWDTQKKYREYETAGVKEYYIVYANDDKLMGFYRLNERGMYVPIKPGADGLIQSSVLPGFQFRLDDLYRRPSLEKMASDPVYEKFVFPAYNKALHEKELALQQVKQERQEKELALQQVEQERQEKEQERQEKERERQEKEQERQEKELAQQKVAKMAEQLRKLGIVQDKL